MRKCNHKHTKGDWRKGIKRGQHALKWVTEPGTGIEYAVCTKCGAVQGAKGCYFLCNPEKVDPYQRGKGWSGESTVWVDGYYNGVMKCNNRFI